MSKRLEEIKNEIAKEYTYKDWNHLRDFNLYKAKVIENYMDEVIIRYAREVAQASLERASEKTTEQYVRPITLNYQDIKNLITNPDNILML